MPPTVPCCHVERLQKPHCSLGISMSRNLKGQGGTQAEGQVCWHVPRKTHLFTYGMEQKLHQANLAFLLYWSSLLSSWNASSSDIRRRTVLRLSMAFWNHPCPSPTMKNIEQNTEKCFLGHGWWCSVKWVSMFYLRQTLDPT